MMGIAGILFIVVVVAVVSLGLAFLLDTVAQNVAWQRRALYAALGGSFIPMSLPLVTLLLEIGEGPEMIVPIMGIVVMALILAAVAGFPAAYWLSKRCERARDPDIFK